MKEKNRFSTYKELLIDAIIILMCVIVIPRFVVQRTIVSGTSMENTLQDKDNLLVEKVSYLVGKPDRFDVVVFYPYGKEEGEYYVKRVIGLPGETIQIIGETIYIDGEKLQEAYGKDPITFQGIAAEPLTLGDNEYFLMGDNRTVSFDSRYQEIGPVKEDMIVGKALVRIWPFDTFGSFKQKK
ncbi:MAG: signal peptidase I [Velocimicrobium sp.]